MIRQKVFLFKKNRILYEHALNLFDSPLPKGEGARFEGLWHGSLSLA